VTGSIVLAVAVLVGALAVLNLVLTYGVIRRLREHTRMLADQTSADTPLALPAAGTPLPGFSATTADGTVVTDADLAGPPAFVGFFSATCAPCKEQLPQFVERLAGVDPRRLVVVLSDAQVAPADAETMLAAARGHARILMEPRDGLPETFGVNRYPTMLTIDNGVVLANTQVAARLPSMAAT
jgi:hypothetical protein